MSPEFRRVLAEAKRWGVKVKIFNPKKVKLTNFRTIFRDHFPGERVVLVDYCAPVANAGILWSTTRTKRVIKWVDGKSSFMANQLLHELMHAVQRQDPRECEEVNGPLLGLETEAARRLKLKGRREYMRDWGVQDALPGLQGDWADITPFQRRLLIQNSQREAVRAKLMKKGRPVYPRKSDESD